MAVSIEDIKKLRAMTGAGLADVKKALTEADGDFDKPNHAHGAILLPCRNRHQLL